MGVPEPSPWEFARRLVRNRLAVVGAALTVLVSLVAVFGPWLAPYDPLKHDVTSILTGPSPKHVFGTDQFGRDVFSRVIHGARPSVLVGLSTVVLAGLIGVPVGLVSGYYGGWTDVVLGRVVDVAMSFPTLLIAITLVAVIGGSTKSVIIALGLTVSPRFARVVRGQTLSVKQRDFVEASRAIGSSSGRVMARHILPNVVSPILVMFTLYLPFAILVESTLSFLGIGVGPDTPTWGRVIADGREYLVIAPWISSLSGLAILVTSVGMNLLGDGLRDVLDPRLKGGAGQL